VGSSYLIDTHATVSWSAPTIPGGAFVAYPPPTWLLRARCSQTLDSASPDFAGGASAGLSAAARRLVDLTGLTRLGPSPDKCRCLGIGGCARDRRSQWYRARHILRPSTTQIAVIFCETSRPTKWDIDKSPSCESPATPPRWRHYRWITRRPRLSDVHIRPDMTRRASLTYRGNSGLRRLPVCTR
jgi:hypothetical protein